MSKSQIRRSLRFYLSCLIVALLAVGFTPVLGPVLSEFSGLPVAVVRVTFILYALIIGVRTLALALAMRAVQGGDR